jgi:CO/xanthine dehydrogenase FAD-binding subunit
MAPMKPPPFDYCDPRDTDEAVGLLADGDDGTKVLAGGQSLVPLLNFRLARPNRLIDINRIDDLAYIRRRDGRLHVGTLTRQTAVEHSAVIAAGWPLLSAAIRFVAHPQVRNRGTVGGSVAHADAAAELPAALLALQATFHARSVRGTRMLAARDFFRGHLTTALAPDELLVEIEVPPPPPMTGHGFAELARRHGDFALGGAAVLITPTAEGVCSRAVIALLAAASTPTRAAAAEDALIGRRVTPELAKEAARSAVTDIRPTANSHASSEYRRTVLAALTRHAILDAAQAATKQIDAAAG